MIILPVILGVGAALFLLTAGYLLGVKQGARAREQLRTQELASAQHITQLRTQLSQRENDPDTHLRMTIEQVLSPLVQREHLAQELSRLEGRTGHRSDLTKVLDQIAEKGNFPSVLLSDDEGWPLASSHNAKDIDKLGALSSLLLLVADRISRDDKAAPLSLMVHDRNNTLTLCRIFQVNDHRLALTAVSPGSQLVPTALDPALVKLEAVLSAQEEDE
jgi:hypothetical protein